jgi:hypothetical protein
MNCVLSMCNNISSFSLPFQNHDAHYIHGWINCWQLQYHLRYNIELTRIILHGTLYSGEKAKSVIGYTVGCMNCRDCLAVNEMGCVVYLSYGEVCGREQYGKYGEFGSAFCMRRTLTETKYKVKTTCFCFSFCMEAFLGDAEYGWVKILDTCIVI